LLSFEHVERQIKIIKKIKESVEIAGSFFYFFFAKKEASFKLIFPVSNGV
jgi:hypothetical protein